MKKRQVFPQSPIQIEGSLSIREDVSKSDPITVWVQLAFLTRGGGKSGVYEIRNLKTGDFYVGMSRNLEIRWRRHLNDLKTYRHINHELQMDWNDLGESGFEFRVIIYCKPSSLTFFEAILIASLNPYYNART